MRRSPTWSGCSAGGPSLPAESAEFTLCAKTGRLAEGGACPVHRGDACLEQWNPKLDRERRSLLAALHQVLGVLAHENEPRPQLDEVLRLTAMAANLRPLEVDPIETLLPFDLRGPNATCVSCGGSAWDLGASWRWSGTGWEHACPAMPRQADA